MADVYDTSFRTLIYKCHSLVLPLLNETFGEHYNGNEQIVFDQNEQMIETPKEPVGNLSEEDGRTNGTNSSTYKKRITDTNFTVFAGSIKNYHLECESKPFSASMLIRLYEYDTQLALRNSVTEGNTIRVKYPNTAVLYLKDISTIPDEMKMIIEVSENTEVIRKVRVIRMRDYSAEEIIRKRLYILIPFYLFNYEKRFKECNDDPEKLEELLNDLRYLETELDALVNESRIDSFQQRVIKNCIKDVSDQLAQNYDNVRKGVEDVMVGPIADYEVIRIHDEGIEEGRKEGIKENETKYLLSLLKHVNAGMISIDGAASIANMSVEEFKKASADLNS